MGAIIPGCSLGWCHAFELNVVPPKPHALMGRAFQRPLDHGGVTLISGLVH